MLEQQADREEERPGEGLEAHHRRRLPPEERRDEILGAALAAFAEVGYEQATLNDVAERLGVTKGCLYHYFDSKEQLLLELVRGRMVHWPAEDAEWMRKATGAREEVLREFVERIWEHLQEPGQIELITLNIAVLPKVPEVGRLVFDEVCAPGRRILTRALMHGREGELSEGEASVLAAVIPYMVLGVALFHHLFKDIEPRPIPPERLGELVTSTILRGIGAACEEARRCQAREAGVQAPAEGAAVGAAGVEAARVEATEVEARPLEAG